MAVAALPPQPVPERINVLGVGVSVLDMKAAVSKIIAGADQPRHAGYVTVTGV